jgi:hypothetical protein
LALTRFVVIHRKLAKTNALGAWPENEAIGASLVFAEHASASTTRSSEITGSFRDIQ